jgi:hypothetical protein
MSARPFGHVGDATTRQLEEALAAAPQFTQSDVDYLRERLPINLGATATTQDEMVAFSHNCAKAEGMTLVIDHMQSIVDARKAPK